MKKRQAKTYEIDGIKYCKSNNRMIYNPDYHDRYGKGWTHEEKAYLVQSRPFTDFREISLALGRTEGTCISKYYMLKRRGLLEFYKNYEEE